MTYYRQNFENVLFVVASDDQSWCHQHLSAKDVTFTLRSLKYQVALSNKADNFFIVHEFIFICQSTGKMLRWKYDHLLISKSITTQSGQNFCFQSFSSYWQPKVLHSRLSSGILKDNQKCNKKVRSTKGFLFFGVTLTYADSAHF